MVGGRTPCRLWSSSPSSRWPPRRAGHHVGPTATAPTGGALAAPPTTRHAAARTSAVRSSSPAAPTSSQVKVDCRASRKTCPPTRCRPGRPTPCEGPARSGSCRAARGRGQRRSGAPVRDRGGERRHRGGPDVLRRAGRPDTGRPERMDGRGSRLSLQRVSSYARPTSAIALTSSLTLRRRAGIR